MCLTQSFFFFVCLCASPQLLSMTTRAVSLRDNVSLITAWTQPGRLPFSTKAARREPDFLFCLSILNFSGHRMALPPVFLLATTASNQHREQNHQASQNPAVTLPSHRNHEQNHQNHESNHQGSKENSGNAKQKPHAGPPPHTTNRTTNTTSRTTNTTRSSGDAMFSHLTNCTSWTSIVFFICDL